jgi:multidrug resistance efflux pump
MMSPFARIRRALLLPSVVVVSFALLGVGVATSRANGNLVGATPKDEARARAPYAPATGLDVVAPLPGRGEVGGAGAIEPADRPVSLVTETSGVVAEVLVVEGARVEAGQPLLRLRGDAPRAELAAARADARAAAGEVAALEADAAAASARAALARTTADRVAALAEKGAATADDRDRATRTSEADDATSRATGARARQAVARVRAAEARIALAEARVAELELRAPAAGEVLQVLVRPGEAVSPTTPAIVVGDTSRLRARLDVNERDALAVAIGQRARVRVEGASVDLPGRVVEVARRVGRKKVRTEDPTERQDARFVETVVELDQAPRVPVGIRVQGYVEVTPKG